MIKLQNVKNSLSTTYITYPHMDKEFYLLENFHEIQKLFERNTVFMPAGA